MMILRTAVATFCILLGSSLPVSSRPQERAQRPVGPPTTTTVYTVLVDVVATDRRDRHVNDLRPEEFELYENGVRQGIDSVEIQTDSGVELIRTQRGPEGAGPAKTAPRVHLINFLLDYSTTDFVNQKYVREAAIKYVQEKVGPNDLVAVFSTSVGGSLRALQAFTSDKKLLVESLGKGDVTGTAYRGERALLNAQISGASQGATADANLASSQAGGAGFTPAGAVAGASTGSARARAMLARRIENSFTVLRSFTDAQVARPILTAIKSIALAEAEIPGRKSLILFSEGFVVPPNVEQVMRDAVDAANKANLAIYSVDTQGLRTREVSGRGELESINAVQGRDRVGSTAGESLFDKARQVGSDQDESTLRFIAHSTGGLLVRNTNDFGSALQRIDDDLRTYYLLSYRPTNLEFDGKFREIRVEVTRPGVKVRSRNGYFATPPSDLLLSPQQRALFAEARKGGASSLPLYARADALFTGSTSASAVVAIELPTDSLEFRQNGTNFDDSLQIVGLIQDASGRAVATFGRPLPLLFNKTQLEAVRGGFVSHSESVSLDPGEYSVELLVHESSSGHSGYYSRQLTLAPPSDFEVSNLILSRQIVKATPESQADPLVTGAARVVPSASRRFYDGDKLIFYFDIYGMQPKNSRASVEVTLAMTRDGKPLGVKLPAYNIEDGVSSNTFRLQVAKYLELAGLSPGSYALVVRARDRNSGATSSAESPFTIGVRP